ncbi:MAG TPA: hypothetical protein VGR32_05170 [Brevundimonas sp.]|jgi:hypothetical protein|uniref:hypothetical protein n=1 Tax=Brevundimonas sp. TaxID=1871086 RepID=UPI002DEF45F9|nr:hypothetical protein [Brevundimonas sp.]
MIWLFLALVSLGGQDRGQSWEVIHETAEVWVGHDASRYGPRVTIRNGWFVVAERAPEGREAFSVMRISFDCATPRFNVTEKWRYDVDGRVFDYAKSRDTFPVSPNTAEAAMHTRVCADPPIPSSTAPKSYPFPAALAEGARAAR